MTSTLKTDNQRLSGTARQMGKTIIYSRLNIPLAMRKEEMKIQLLAVCRFPRIPDSYIDISDDALERYVIWKGKVDEARLKRHNGVSSHIYGFLAAIAIWNFPRVNQAMEVLVNVDNANTTNSGESEYYSPAISYFSFLNTLLSIGITLPELRIVEYFDKIVPAFDNTLFSYEKLDNWDKPERALRSIGLTPHKLIKLIYQLSDSKLDFGHFTRLMQRITKNKLTTMINLLSSRCLNKRECDENHNPMKDLSRDNFDFYLWSKSNQWFNKITTVVVDEDNDIRLRVHHHTAFWKVESEYRYNRPVTVGGVTRLLDEHIEGLDFNTSPKHFYTDIIKQIAFETYRDYKDIVYADYSQILQNEVEGISYISNAIDTLMEGDKMQHCVGGEEFVSECKNGRSVIFHSDSPECLSGLTVALRVNNEINNPEPDNCDLSSFCFTITRNQTAYHLTLMDLKGRNNRNPSPQEIKHVFDKLCRVFNITV